LISDDAVATHLYRIAQEAVNNAVKHGYAQNIRISLCAEAENTSLTIEDDGCGLPQDVRNSPGMGLHIMNYRAKMIGATLQVQRGAQGGTVVMCVLQPVNATADGTL